MSPGSGLTCGDGARSTFTVGIVAPFIVGAGEGRRCVGMRPKVTSKDFNKEIQT